MNPAPCHDYDDSEWEGEHMDRPDPLASESEHLAWLRRWLGSEGEPEVLSDEVLYEAWTDYSGDYCASFLIANESTARNFAGYLLRDRARLLRNVP